MRAGLVAPQLSRELSVPHTPRSPSQTSPAWGHSGARVSALDGGGTSRRGSGGAGAVGELARIAVREEIHPVGRALGRRNRDQRAILRHAARGCAREWWARAGRRRRGARRRRRRRRRCWRRRRRRRRRGRRRRRARRRGRRRWTGRAGGQARGDVGRIKLVVEQLVGGVRRQRLGDCILGGHAEHRVRHLLGGERRVD